MDATSGQLAWAAVTAAKEGGWQLRGMLLVSWRQRLIGNGGMERGGGFFGDGAVAGCLLRRRRTRQCVRYHIGVTGRVPDV
jgi:hypothetical protein